jgi:uncharacterized protein
MRSLLDINVLIALLDSDHVAHERAHTWWKKHKGEGWASCPITENGVVRIMSNSAYSKTEKFSPASLIERLRTFVDETDHEFWADDVSILSDNSFHAERLVSTKQVTDVYLLAVAVKNGGSFATLDSGISRGVVVGAREEHLSII